MPSYYSLCQSFGRGQVALERVKKGRKAAFVFPKPDWRGNSCILPAYRTVAESLLSWPTAEGRLQSGTAGLGSPLGHGACQQRKRRRKLNVREWKWAGGRTIWSWDSGTILL